MRHAIVTGSAGFIGRHLVTRLALEGWRVSTLDSFQHPGDDIRYPQEKRFSVGRVDCILHFAALAGVRPSLKDPVLYQQVNVVGTQQILELARALRVPQVIFASSSSV